METFEELSSQIMRLLQAQLNALELDTLTTEELYKCDERRERIQELTAQLGKLKNYRIPRLVGSTTGSQTQSPKTTTVA